MCKENVCVCKENVVCVGACMCVCRRVCLCKENVSYVNGDVFCVRMLCV